MRIKDLKKDHPFIYKRILECISEQGLILDNSASIPDSFTWRRTKEGDTIWSGVNLGKFASFYEFHKLKIIEVWN